ncbi:hypothetical protein [Saccharicrinis aurantiacus]|uniref:hypothetical protein n=1 Tax=Saccharicrinis aurantiacus TaxID=1849719 RepID=UPI00249100DE|nr:hypothetical protein [Saccharicrinis aurantiacus]
MNKQTFSQLINNQSKLDEKSLAQLKEVIEEYPFFQMGRMLMLKNLHQLDHIKFNSELKHSAAYIADRSKLFFLLHKIETLEHLEKEPTEEIDDEVSVAPQTDIAAPEPDEKKQKQITLTDNYLNASDELSDDIGLSLKINNPQSETKENKALDEIVLPAADLLDYERSITPAYSLNELEELNEKPDSSNHSFSDWLFMMKNKKAKAKKVKEVNKKMDLIENFLSTDPKITPNPSKPKKEIDLSESHNKVSEDIMSETLANIFVKQGHNNKAISILEKLRLKYPEKNAYFARRISELKEN